jgi:hypothetical protein
MGKHPEFAGYWRQKIAHCMDTGKSVPSLADLISQFRMQRQEKLAAKDSHSAYATTLQGQEIKPKEKPDEKEDSHKALKPCLCGETHP